jgi:hypothetical protein
VAQGVPHRFTDDELGVLHGCLVRYRVPGQVLADLVAQIAQLLRSIQVPVHEDQSWAPGRHEKVAVLTQSIRSAMLRRWPPTILLPSDNAAACLSCA